MSKRDWLRECNDQNVPPQEFHQIFCIRCRNPDCTRAGYSGSLWADRITTQVERLLENPLYADLTLPQYAKVNALDFPDALRQALRIEIASKRGDWELPPEDIDTDRAMQELLAAAPDKPKPVTKAAQLEVTVDGDADAEDSPDGDDSPSPTVTETKLMETPTQTYPQGVPQPVLLTRTNTAFPVGGIMLDGSRPTQVSKPTPKLVVPEADPWAVPAPVENVVPVGAKIRLGLAGADGNGNEGKK